MSVWRTFQICALFRLKFQRCKPTLYRHLPIPVSPLAFDTTFNIGEFKVSTKNEQCPWFPGSILVHRKERKIDFETY